MTNGTWPSNAELAVYINADGEVIAAQQKGGKIITDPGRNLMGAGGKPTLDDPPPLVVRGSKAITLLKLGPSGGTYTWWPHDPFTCYVYCP